jgi:hypothetical protein
VAKRLLGRGLEYALALVPRIERARESFFPEVATSIAAERPAGPSDIAPTTRARYHQEVV